MVPDQLDIWLRQFGDFLEYPFGHMFDQLIKRLAALGFSSAKLLVNTIAFTCLCMFHLFIACIIYWTLYWFLIPQKEAQRPIFFDFSQESPVAMVSLVDNQWEYLQRIPHTHHNFLSPGLSYDIDVEFRLADSVVDSQKGMLMLEATALSTRPISHSKRPVEIHKTPFIHRMFWQTILIFPTLLELHSQTSVIKTKIFESFVDSREAPISTVNLTMIRSPTHQGELHLTDARMNFLVQLSGIRWFISAFFWPSAFVAIAVLTLAQLLGSLALLYYFWPGKPARVLKGRRYRSKLKSFPNLTFDQNYGRESSSPPSKAQSVEQRNDEGGREVLNDHDDPKVSNDDQDQNMLGDEQHREQPDHPSHDVAPLGNIYDGISNDVVAMNDDKDGMNPLSNGIGPLNGEEDGMRFFAPIDSDDSNSATI